jgi:hypothetical protein
VPKSKQVKCGIADVFQKCKHIFFKKYILTPTLARKSFSSGSDPMDGWEDVESPSKGPLSDDVVSETQPLKGSFPIWVPSLQSLGNYQRSQGTYAFGVFSTLTAVDFGTHGPVGARLRVAPRWPHLLTTLFASHPVIHFLQDTLHIYPVPNLNPLLLFSEFSLTPQAIEGTLPYSLPDLPSPQAAAVR